MDEDQYRAVYREINQQRCVFEKAINNRRCDCREKRRFLLATREGVACEDTESQQRCTLFLDTLREGSRFALRETQISGPLPHNKELKVQAGGCLALQQLLPAPDKPQTTNTSVSDALLYSGDKTPDTLPPHSTLPDIAQLLDQGHRAYGSISTLPYGELVKGVLNYQSRRKRRGGQ
ncbi:MAG: hypothetical protein ACPGSM_01320 [Thiolinea sp.]